MRQLRISTVLDLPDDAFEQSRLLGELAPHKADFERGLEKVLGRSVLVEARIVTPQVRTAKPAAGPQAQAPVAEIRDELPPLERAGPPREHPPTPVARPSRAA